jgi:hypothetical protein
MEQGASQPESIREQNVWNSTDKIVIEGSHFETITNFLGLFRPALIALDATIQKNKASGVIKSEYFDEKGNPIAEEVVQQLFAALSEQSEK